MKQFLLIISVLGLVLLFSLLVLNIRSSNKKQFNGPKQQASSSPQASDSAQVQGVLGEQAVVTKVVDGDTIEVRLNDQLLKVRYIGIDTPETVDPRRAVGCFGKEASAENKRLVLGQKVIMQKDVSETDKFGRLLRYVYMPLEDGQALFVNDYLVRSGFARASSYPPDVKYQNQFKEAESEARGSRVGLWGSC